MDRSNLVDSIQLQEKGPMYIHPDSDFSCRPPVSSREQLREMYPECFGGIGTFKNYKYHIEIDKSVKPVIHGVRKVALALIPRLDQGIGQDGERWDHSQGEQANRLGQLIGCERKT